MLNYKLHGSSSDGINEKMSVMSCFQNCEWRQWLNLKTLFVGKFKIKISVRWGRPESGTNALLLMRVPYNDFAKFRLFAFDCHDYTSEKLLWMLLWLYSGHDVALATFKLGSWWFVDFIQTGWRSRANYGWLVPSSLGQIQIDFNRFSTTSNRNVWSCRPSLIMCQRVVWPNVKTHQNI